MHITLRPPSIRTKLLWLVLALLIIPWMGYYYVSEMKRFLVQGQKDALLLTAAGIATVLNDRSELFNPETGVPEVLGRENDLYAHALNNLIQLDGNPADWASVQHYASYYTGTEPMLCDADYDPDSFSLKNLIGFYDHYLYALFEVNDEHIVYRDPERLSLDSTDQIRMLLRLPNRELLRFVFVAAKPGRMSAFLVDDEWKLPLDGDDVSDFTAELVETDWGYRIELRISRNIIGYRSKIGFSAVDVDDAESREIKGVISTAPPLSGEETGQILITSPELTKILKGLDQPQSRIWIIDRLRQVRAVVGGLAATPQRVPAPADANWAITLYQQAQGILDRILNRPSARFIAIPPGPDKISTAVLKGEPKSAARSSAASQNQLIVAGYPIRSGDEILGAVLVEQSSHAILALQYQLLTSLTLVTILVFAFILLMLFVFAWRLTVRIRRLYNTTEQAITAEGRVLEDKIPRRRYPRDELGDLGRSITSMLTKLSGYTRYLEGMPDTLAHEMNNPLNVVSSSLQILETKMPEIQHNKHMQRARNGVNRLRLILTNLTEAANLEEAMKEETKEPVDLAVLIAEFVDGYRGSYPQQAFEVENDGPPLVIESSPDHLAQMLDKLIDNAVQFSTESRPIIVRTTRKHGFAEIAVLNEGPPIPEQISDRLFDPMVSFGKTNARDSHLGLGLFVVRLIAEYHQGTARAANRADGLGVEVTVSIPLLNTAVAA